MIKIFTKFELMQKEGYDVLSRILNEAELQIFYNTPQAERGTLIPNKNVRILNPKHKSVPTYAPPRASAPLKRHEFRLTAPPKVIPKINLTQKCTSDVSLQSITRMAIEHMNMDFIYRGKTYNMHRDGWKFDFNTRKRALGLCVSNRYTRTGTIYLSTWIIQNSKEGYDKWVNTMLHEIAHAIDVMIQGVSSHDWRWQSIARSIGCDAERTTKVEYDDLLENPISKYTMVCPNGHTTPSHKVKRSESSCRRCNEAIGGKGFNRDFLLRQVTNW